MLHGQFERMQRDAARRKRALRAVPRVAPDGMTALGYLRTDLMLAACLQQHVDQAKVVVARRDAPREGGALRSVMRGLHDDRAVALGAR